MYLVFADNSIVRDVQIIDGVLPYDEEGLPDYDNADWSDLDDTDILLDVRSEATVKEAIKNTAKYYNTDENNLYAVKIDEFKTIYLNEEE